LLASDVLEYHRVHRRLARSLKKTDQANGQQSRRRLSIAQRAQVHRNIVRQQPVKVALEPHPPFHEPNPDVELPISLFPKPDEVERIGALG
jgi:hypothetical protein